MNRYQNLGQVASAVMLVLSAGIMQHAVAEETAAQDPNKAVKDQLELDLKRLEIRQKQLDLYKSATPDLSNYKLDKPEAPKVEATTSSMSFKQSEQLAKEMAMEISKSLGGAKSVLIESPHLLVYLAANDSVDALLDSSISAVKDSIIALQAVMEPEKVVQPSVPSKKECTRSNADLVFDGNPVCLKSSTRSISMTAIGIIPAIVQSGFAITSAARTKYAFATVANHQSVATTVLQAKVISELQTKMITVYDPEAFLPIAPSLLDEKNAALGEARIDANEILKKAVRKSKGLREKGNKNRAELAADVKEADTIDAQTKILNGVMVEAEKYQLSLHVNDDTGVTPLVQAKRGKWLKERLEETPKVPGTPATVTTAAIPEKPAVPGAARLSVTSILSTSDIVAADGWIKGLRVSASGNTIGQWRLVKADGSVIAGASQSCLPNAQGECMRVVLRAGDLVKQ